LLLIDKQAILLSFKPYHLSLLLSDKQTISPNKPYHLNSSSVTNRPLSPLFQAPYHLRASSPPVTNRPFLLSFKPYHLSLLPLSDKQTISPLFQTLSPEPPLLSDKQTISPHQPYHLSLLPCDSSASSLSNLILDSPQVTKQTISPPLKPPP
ncbi:hypothetical protein RRG08_060900, partial [Elysia crispata]